MVKRKTSCFLDILLSLMPVEIGSCRHWEVSLRRSARSVKMHLIDFSRRMLCASLVLTTVKASSLARHRTGRRKHRCMCGFTYYNLSASRWNWAAGAGWQCGNFFRADPL
ncbi:unnamed protein product [Symbiodinium pilosum]|uniref:Secreted protein n=1 Tax=Symbiodinium pilosum TaxID=2952 RepID=A0A812T4G3_SYMPI|nr:unnamed protein product [Symbiodinium pilosum]